MGITSKKEFDELPIDKRLKLLDEFKKRLEAEMMSILNSSFYCPGCKSYHNDSLVRTICRRETRQETTFTDAGYGDDDMIGDVTYNVKYSVCPSCGYEKEKEKIYMSTANERRRRE